MRGDDDNGLRNGNDTDRWPYDICLFEVWRVLYCASIVKMA